MLQEGPRPGGKPATGNPLFLLSPAHGGGKRASYLLRPEASFDLAVRLRETGAPIGEIYTFLSGLYFRGKLAYARAFGRALVIVPGRGLLPPETVVTLAELRRISRVEVDAARPQFAGPLRRDAKALREAGPVVLLGSVATGKYVDVLAPHLHDRLRFPAAFIGRGDMSRGGLMLRCVADRVELDYVMAVGSVRRGKRPPRLEPAGRAV